MYDDIKVDSSAVPPKDKPRTSNTAYMLVYHREDRVPSEEVGKRFGQGWCWVQMHTGRALFLLRCVCGDRHVISSSYGLPI